jgi:hypothetical protein
MDRRTTCAVSGVMLALTGCPRLSGAANGDHPTQSSAAVVRPVTVGVHQSGTTLLLHMGQEMIVNLGQGFAVPQSVQPSVHYPSDLLAFTSKGTPLGTYVFQGRKVGTGRIWIVRPGCAPGPAPSADAPPANCPVVGPASSDGGGRATWLFTATVRVVPIGL